MPTASRKNCYYLLLNENGLNLTHKTCTMKNLHLISLLFLFLACTREQPEVRWQIKKEYPAYGLTLGYQLAESHIQQIIGDAFRPKLDKHGKGYLMLFIASAQKYYLDDLPHQELGIAHILVYTENSLNCPLSIGLPDQALNTVLEENHFAIEEGKIALNLTEVDENIQLKASIVTPKGKIEIRSIFENVTAETEEIENTKVSATANTNSSFIGNESFNTVPIDSVEIISEGENWLNTLDLPSKPDDIWLNKDFVWDFTFTQK